MLNYSILRTLIKRGLAPQVRAQVEQKLEHRSTITEVLGYTCLAAIRWAPGEARIKQYCYEQKDPFNLCRYLSNAVGIEDEAGVERFCLEALTCAEAPRTDKWFQDVHRTLTRYGGSRPQVDQFSTEWVQRVRAGEFDDIPAGKLLHEELDRQKQRESEQDDQLLKELQS